MVPNIPESLRLARGIFATGAFSNPFPTLDTGPSAHLSPVFPAFLALLMKVFGDGSSGIYAIKLAAVLLLSLQLALFPAYSRALGMGAVNGVIAATIWIVAKPQIVYVWEALDAALLLAAACCLYRRYLDSEPKRRVKLAWLLGALAGFLILMAPTVAPIYATWLAWAAWRRNFLVPKESLLPLALLPVLIVAPWTIRNYLVFNSFPIIRDDFGLELSVSNNFCAQFSEMENDRTGCLQRSHPYFSMDEATKVADLGEVRYNRSKSVQAVHWIRSRPGRFVRLTAMRFVAFWMPAESFSLYYSVGRRLERIVIELMTLFSGLGLIILYRRDLKSAAILFSCLSVFPLVYYFIQFVDRYRYPIMWVTFLLGAMPITAVAQRLWKSWAVEKAS
ncbi:MAG: hypothetical protein WBE97_10520 [Candidatus Acidiferrales bacterium]